MSEFLDTAINAAQAGGKILKSMFAGTNEQTYKDPNNVVTEADTASEKVIMNILQTAYPDHGIFSEEAGAMNIDREYVWVIDPLDGTTNFAHHIGYFCVSIALVKDSDLQLGVIYSPLNDEVFSAEINQGATLNDKPIKPSTISDISQAVISLNRNSGSAEKKHYAANVFPTMTSLIRSPRVLGSSALDLAYVASGRLDAHINNGCKFYDAAAGAIIAQEAGALVTNFAGAPWKPPIDGSEDLLVANQHLHGEFASHLAKI